MSSLDLASPLILAIAAVGALGIGLLGGMTGLVLGSLRLPLLLLLEHQDAVAAGTNIGVSGSGAVTATLRHWREGRIHWPLFWTMGSGSILGAFVGGYMSGSVPSDLLRGLVGTILLYSAVDMARGASTRGPGLPVDGTPRESRALGRRAQEAGLGLGIGLLGGMVGLILGSLRLPAMIRLLGVDPRIAAGTNMPIGFFTGLFGLGGHLISHGVNWPLLLAMAPAAMLGSWIGARWTGLVSPATLRRWMAGLLMVIALAMLFLALRGL